MSLSCFVLIFCCDESAQNKSYCMKDTIIKLFNLEPSELQDIEIVSVAFSVHAIITLKVRSQTCPVCGYSTKHIHVYCKRTLSHAVINDVYTNIIFNQRRYRCTNCDIFLTVNTKKHKVGYLSTG